MLRMPIPAWLRDSQCRRFNLGVCRCLSTIAVIVVATSTASAQKNPELGYVFPAGAPAGATLDVQLGGYDWTPDMEFFVLDAPLQISVQGPPGELLIPPPPYWFGARGKVSALPLPREVPAKLTIPPGTPPGVYHWQAANANGGTAVGSLVVGAGREVVEAERRRAPQELGSLPVTVSGRLLRNEEVDEYLITPSGSGPISCELWARRLGANFHGVLSVRDLSGKLITDAADGAGEDLALTFRGEQGNTYVLSVRDIDHAGDRSYVYRLSVTAGPRVATTLPAAGRRGETREMEFIGPGLATGSAQWESVKRTITFPADRDRIAFSYQIETPFGISAPVLIKLSDSAETVAAPPSDLRPVALPLPAAVSGKLDPRFREHRYEFSAKKGETWTILLESRAVGGSLDAFLSLIGPDGKELAQSDDLPGTIDAGLPFSAPADGQYVVVVSDRAGKATAPDAIYRLEISQPVPDFQLQSTQRVNVLLGGKLDLVVKANRSGGFKEPIALQVAGLPAGLIPPAELVIPGDKSELAIPLQPDPSALATAALVRITGTAQLGGQLVSRAASFTTAANLSPRVPRDNEVPAALVTTMMRPRCKGVPVDQDTVRKVHRGSTFPAEVDLTRLEGYTGEVQLKQAARQSYQVQGITGTDTVVPAGVSRAAFPCFMPEWLETSRTSRMGIISVVQIPDAAGRMRHLVGEVTGFVTMSMEGALLKLSTGTPEIAIHPGDRFSVALKISRSAKIPEPARVELRLADDQAGLFATPATVVPFGQDEVQVEITAGMSPEMVGEHELTLRATVLQNGVLPTVSETKVLVDVRAAPSK
ncbi:MAG: PPC domain-containing protein [Planctomycetes bacterium]|nr:PPC domain-containing protein [Planctomycetota bacterium]